MIPLMLAFALVLPRQEQDPGGTRARPEIWRLSEVIAQAVRKVAASVVTVETFGGVRRGPGDENRRPDPTSRPGAPDFHLPDPKKEPEADPEEEEDEDPREWLRKIRAQGFAQAQGAGTGIVLSPDGWILTTRFQLNYRPSSILVTLPDGRKFNATMHGEDETRGIILLKIDAEGLPVPEHVPAGEVKVGQWVFAIGRAFGARSPTVHSGIVSALRRIGGRALQCDACTSPANYGGPLIDIEGRVLGIVTPLSPEGDIAGAKWYDSGIGFATTLAGIEDVFAGMKKGRVYRRAMLGVVVDPSFLGPGARILSISKRSTAHHARLAKGDVILAVGGEKVRNPLHLKYLLGSYVAGAFTRIRVEK
ncbi:MAG: S1C family serine protease, partial [Planctomycetota bacterium]